MYRISLISKDQKENIIRTIDDVRGDVLGPSHNTTPAAEIANENENGDPLRAVNIFMIKEMCHTRFRLLKPYQ